MAIPAFGGASAAAASGTTIVSPGIPSGVATGDLMLAILAGGNTGVWSVNNQAGGSWTNIGQAEVGTTTTSANIQVFADYYNGTQTAPTFNTPGNNGVGRIIYITGARAADEAGPFGGMSADLGDTSGDTACSLVSGLTTVDNDCLIVLAAAAADDSPTFGATWTNANLGSVTVRASDVTISGNDSSCEIVTGTLATAGAVGTFTNTLTGAVNVAALVLAIRPPLAGTAYTEAAETDAAQPFGKTLGVPAALETDAALRPGITLGYGLAASTELAGAFVPAKVYTAAIETDAAQGFGVRLGYGSSLEADVAAAIGKTLGIAAATEVDLARALGIRLGLSPASEVDLAGILELLAGGPVVFTAALESDMAGSFTAVEPVRIFLTPGRRIRFRRSDD